MPELPEVETIRRALERELHHARLKKLRVFDAKLLQNAGEQELQRALIGRRLEEVGRRGKFLILNFGDQALVLHLRMTGWLSLNPSARPRLVMQFDSREALYLEDTRRFATLYLSSKKDFNALPALAQLGLEPFQSDYTFKAFVGLMKSEQEVKRLLLDQRKISGLGNIYACEALFATGIHPLRRADRLTAREARRLFEVIPEILKRAIVEQGTSVDTYRLLRGERGNFQNLLQVYGREGQPCPRCHDCIERIVQGGRSSFFCSSCQPLRRRDSLAGK